MDEYCRIIGQNRKAVIRKIRSGKYVKSLRKEKREEKRERSKTYGKDVAGKLIKLWEIFERPCGQRLKAIITEELDRLRAFGEIEVDDEMRLKLNNVSARSIDTLLKPHKVKERLNKKYKRANHPLLYQKIPVKLSHEQGREVGDTIQIDLVEHCGISAEGDFINTVSTTCIGSGWWEGMAIFGKTAKAVHGALYQLEKQYPFAWGEIHPDNGSEFINEVLYGFTEKNGMAFSRSRPYHKNDNCFVEQKNSTHVRKIVGHQRYDTKKELDTLNELYEILCLYKNFFQPIIPLKSKERINGSIKRRYGTPQTPYHNVMASTNISKKGKQELKKIYNGLNPAELKRQITGKQDRLHALRQSREREYTRTAGMNRQLNMQNQEQNLNQVSVAKLIAEPTRVRLHS